MDDVRKLLEGAVSKSRPDLPDEEQRRLVDRVLDIMEPQPAEGAARLKPNNSIRFVIRCERNGTLKEVIDDALSLGSRLAPGVELTSVVSPFHLRRVARFLRTVRQHRSSYDCVLSVLAPSGLVRCYCSGFVAKDDIVAIATAEPLAISVPRELGVLAEQRPDILKAPMKELTAWRKNNKDSGTTPEDPSAVLVPERQQTEGISRTRSGRRLLELAAHDLRNPISGVLAACQYLLADTVDSLEPHQTLVLYSIESSAQLALRLIESLSEISSIRLEEPELNLAPTDIVSVLQQSISGVRHLADIMNVHLQLRVREQPPTVTADPARLVEAFHGLLVTAIDGPQAAGKIDIVIDKRSREAVITLRREYTSTRGEPAGAEPRGGLSRGAARKLTDLHTALLLARTRRILKTHGGGVRTGPHTSSGRSWTVTVPTAAEPATRTHSN